MSLSKKTAPRWKKRILSHQDFVERILNKYGLLRNNFLAGGSLVHRRIFQRKAGYGSLSRSFTVNVRLLFAGFREQGPAVYLPVNLHSVYPDNSFRQSANVETGVFLINKTDGSKTRQVSIARRQDPGSPARISETQVFHTGGPAAPWHIQSNTDNYVITESKPVGSGRDGGTKGRAAARRPVKRVRIGQLTTINVRQKSSKGKTIPEQAGKNAEPVRESNIHKYFCLRRPASSAEVPPGRDGQVKKRTPEQFIHSNNIIVAGRFIPQRPAVNKGKRGLGERSGAGGIPRRRDAGLGGRPNAPGQAGMPGRARQGAWVQAALLEAQSALLRLQQKLQVPKAKPGRSLTAARRGADEAVQEKASVPALQATPPGRQAMMVVPVGTAAAIIIRRQLHTLERAFQTPADAIFRRAQAVQQYIQSNAGTYRTTGDTTNTRATAGELSEREQTGRLTVADISPTVTAAGLIRKQRRKPAGAFQIPAGYAGVTAQVLQRYIQSSVNKYGTASETVYSPAEPGQARGTGSRTAAKEPVKGEKTRQLATTSIRQALAKKKTIPEQADKHIEPVRKSDIQEHIYRRRPANRAAMPPGAERHTQTKTLEQFIRSKMIKAAERFFSERSVSGKNAKEPDKTSGAMGIAYRRADVDYLSGQAGAGMPGRVKTGAQVWATPLEVQFIIQRLPQKLQVPAAKPGQIMPVGRPGTEQAGVGKANIPVLRTRSHRRQPPEITLDLRTSYLSEMLRAAQQAAQQYMQSSAGEYGTAGNKPAGARRPGETGVQATAVRLFEREQANWLREADLSPAATVSIFARKHRRKPGGAFQAQVGSSSRIGQTALQYVQINRSNKYSPAGGKSAGYRHDTGKNSRTAAGEPVKREITGQFTKASIRRILSKKKTFPAMVENNQGQVPAAKPGQRANMPVFRTFFARGYHRWLPGRKFESPAGHLSGMSQAAKQYVKNRAGKSMTAGDISAESGRDGEGSGRTAATGLFKKGQNRWLTAAVILPILPAAAITALTRKQRRSPAGAFQTKTNPIGGIVPLALWFKQSSAGKYGTAGDKPAGSGQGAGYSGWTTAGKPARREQASRLRAASSRQTLTGKKTVPARADKGQGPVRKLHAQELAKRRRPADSVETPRGTEASAQKEILERFIYGDGRKITEKFFPQRSGYGRGAKEPGKVFVARGISRRYASLSMRASALFQADMPGEVHNYAWIQQAPAEARYKRMSRQLNQYAGRRQRLPVPAAKPVRILPAYPGSQSGAAAPAGTGADAISRAKRRRPAAEGLSESRSSYISKLLRAALRRVQNSINKYNGSAQAVVVPPVDREAPPGRSLIEEAVRISQTQGSSRQLVRLPNNGRRRTITGGNTEQTGNMDKFVQRGSTVIAETSRRYELMTERIKLRRLELKTASEELRLPLRGASALFIPAPRMEYLKQQAAPADSGQDDVPKSSAQAEVHLEKIDMPASQGPEINIDKIVDKVYMEIERKIKLERQRRGF